MVSPPDIARNGLAQGFPIGSQMPDRLAVSWGKLSVHARIIVIALIPIFGFLFNAVSYRAGDSEVARAFASARRGAAVAEAGGDLKGAISIMQISAPEFVARPTQQLAQTFDAALRLAALRLDAIAQSLGSEAADEVAVGIATVLIGFLMSWLIARSVNQPLHRLAGAMQQLAGGDTQVEIPGTDAKNEIGDMARTVLVFRNSMIERQQLAITQLEAARAREVRSEIINTTIIRFD
jgi:methyl-accepting chemotaxis protein